MNGWKGLRTFAGSGYIGLPYGKKVMVHGSFMAIVYRM